MPDVQRPRAGGRRSGGATQRSQQRQPGAGENATRRRAEETRRERVLEQAPSRRTGRFHCAEQGHVLRRSTRLAVLHATSPRWRTASRPSLFGFVPRGGFFAPGVCVLGNTGERTPGSSTPRSAVRRGKLARPPRRALRKGVSMGCDDGAACTCSTTTATSTAWPRPSGTC